MSSISSSSNSNTHSSSAPGPDMSVSLILAPSGISFICLRTRASSGVYFKRISHLSSWKSLREIKTISP